MSKPKNARELREFLFDVDGKPRPDNFKTFTESCEQGKLSLSNFRLNELAEAWGYKPQRGSHEAFQFQAKEAGGMPVDSTTFPQMVSQLLLSTVREQHDLEANVFYPLFKKIPSSLKGTEIIPSVTRIDPDDLEEVGEGEAYPVVGMEEEYFTAPAKTKHGGIVKVTEEALTYAQHADMVRARAQEIGRSLGMLREKQCIDVFIGQTNNYSRNGTAVNTYTTAGVINNATGTALTDWTDIDTAMRLWEDILDPNISEPLAGVPRHLVVMPARLATAGRILAAIQSRTTENSTSARTEETVGAGSPLQHLGLNLSLVSSRQLYQRVLAGPESETAKAQDGWFLGNIDEAFGYYEVWPLRVFQKGMESEEAFSNDVVLQFKASFLGKPACLEKRKILRLENSAWA